MLRKAMSMALASVFLKGRHGSRFFTGGVGGGWGADSEALYKLFDF
jgi:hypothetical protein